MKQSLIQSLKYAVLASSLALSPLTLAQAATPQHTGINMDSSATISVYDSNNYQVNESSKMFPEPIQGMVQHVIALPKLADEQHYKLEVSIGQKKWVDCNKHGLSGTLQHMTLSGWGYEYYQVNTITEGPSTMMACFDMAKTEAFLTIPGSLMLNYDSRLPKVFYLPQGAQLRYRIWNTNGEYHYSPEK
ncbi:serine protease inhibitor ecotin [Shewanella psychrotolerans]|uniref:serine protease inhibitor ecotin n=1 Tax=Shewanella psychrotolerans TaxID=2864206 RepID=UPI001C65D2A1|nr:serine protease inhibitor ecotin [Shewanella psychrotolerans]QYJ99895.1 serine protease inhibitor ecotin [Shewanella psychrotolerans]